MLKSLFAILLIAHGLVHAGMAAAPDPGDPDSKPGAFFTSPARSWLFLRLGLNPSSVRWIGLLLVALAVLGFVLAGLGVFGMPRLVEVWRTVAVVSASVSLLLLIIFWHPWLIVGVLIDAGLLIALLWGKWLSANLIGS